MSYNATGPLEAPRKILVVRLGAMGDVIHTLPAAARLKCSFPQAEITWAIESRWAPLLHENPFVDRIFEIPLSRWKRRPFSRATRSELRQARKRLREGQFDLAVDFQGLLKSAMVTYFSRADCVFGFERGELREPLACSFYSNRVSSGSAHVVEKNLDLAAAAGGPAPGPHRVEGSPVFPLPAGTPEPVLPTGAFVLTSPLAGWKAKQWPLEHFAALAGRIWREGGMPLVVDCAASEASYGRQLVDMAPPGACRLHVSSLEGLIAATQRARAVVGVDSGPLHLAAALGVGGVAIYGPTDPARNGPFGGSFTVLRAPQVATSYKRVDEIHPSMRAVSAHAVWSALKPLLMDDRRQKSRETTDRRLSMPASET